MIKGALAGRGDSAGTHYSCKWLTKYIAHFHKIEQILSNRNDLKSDKVNVQ